MELRTPVIVGVGQVTDRLEAPGFAAMSTVDLAAAAGAAAIEDSGGVPVSIAEWIDTVVCPRPMEISGPGRVVLGASTNFPRAVARRIGLLPRRAVLEIIGGQAPQRLVNEFAASIASGEHSAVLLAGGDSTSTQQFYATRADRPDFTDETGGDLEDRGEGWDYYLDDNMLAHHLFVAPAAYGLVDNARRARLGLDVRSYREEMGRLFAPFSQIAAENPHAVVRQASTAEDLAQINAQNPLVWDPYPKRLIAREKVNMGAAVLMMSTDAATRCGIPEDRWVYLRGHADLVDLPFLARPDLSRGPASVAAVQEALRGAGIDERDLVTLDLYSCFAAPVFNICDGLGLSPDDPRGLTVTGGLPFFGGPGANYSTHAIAETVRRLRQAPGSFGLVGSNGGILSKYSVGVYSSEPGAWAPDRGEQVQTELDSHPHMPVTRHADGTGTVDSYTIHHRAETPTGIVVGTLDGDGSRFVAMVTDEALLERLGDDDITGLPIKVTSEAGQNRALSG